MTWDFGFAVCVPVWFRVQVLRKISRAQRCKVSGHDEQFSNTHIM